MILSSNAPKTWSFQIISRWNMIFLASLEKWYFFRKIWYFSFRRKMKDDLSQEIHRDRRFSVYMYKCYKYNITPLPKIQIIFPFLGFVLFPGILIILGTCWLSFLILKCTSTLKLKKIITSYSCTLKLKKIITRYLKL